MVAGTWYEENSLVATSAGGMKNGMVATSSGVN